MSSIEISSLDTRELQLLEKIEKQENLPQRELAKELQLSLGITNLLIKKLAQKGLIAIKKINNRNLKYILTAEGRLKLTQRSKQTINVALSQINRVKKEIDEEMSQAIKEGYKKVILPKNSSQALFLYEYSASQKGLELISQKESKAFPLKERL